MLAPPIGFKGSDHRLLLTVETLPRETRPGHPYLLFMGGFGNEKSEDGGQTDDLSSLVAEYRDRTGQTEELRLALGSLDLSEWESDPSSTLLLSRARRAIQFANDSSRTEP